MTVDLSSSFCLLFSKWSLFEHGFSGDNKHFTLLIFAVCRAMKVSCETFKLEKKENGKRNRIVGVKVAKKEEMDSIVEIEQLIDHTLLKPQALDSDIEQLCQEAKQYGFKSVCINPFYVELAVALLKKTKVVVCTVIDFPLGANGLKTKLFATEQALSAGAKELDMVLNIGALKDEKYGVVAEEIRLIVQKAMQAQALVKVILETCCLTEREKIKACLLAKEEGAAFVKTSTGFAAAGATVEDIKLMRKTVGLEMGVKAAGGIRNLDMVRKMIAAGANRIGTSAGVSIMQDLRIG